MTLTIEKLAAQAAQARIGLSDERMEKLLPALNRAIAGFDVLDEIDTQDIEPLAYVLDLHNIMRADEVRQEFTREQLLANAPKRTDEAFVVPKTVE
jgi:aspartyl-tRNA(Asn)/glutamyl-tRNA(Gln) amidotransferase subunit C